MGLKKIFGNSKNYFILVYFFCGPMQKELGEKKFYSQFYLFSKLQKLAKMTKKLVKFLDFGVAVRQKIFLGNFF